MHGGHVDRWTERATSNMGASHSGACLRAYPRDAVRVHASSPRKRAIRASHSASLRLPRPRFRR
jgi:hypothetical protein